MTTDNDSKKPTWTSVQDPQAGDIAHHRSGTLDSREVARVSEDGSQLWLRLFGLDEFGPYSTANYTYTRRGWE